MKLLKYSPIAIFSIFGALAACGSSDATGGGTPGSGAPCNLVAVAGCDAVVTCSKTHCSADVTTCFGADFKGGACATYTACLNACTGCNDVACRDTCNANIDTACSDCVNGSLDTCETANNCTKAALCTTGAGGGSGSGAGGGSGSGAGGASGSGGGTACAMLTACCPTLPTNVQAGCQALAMQGNETNCAAIYSTTCAGGAGGASGAGAGGFAGSGTAGASGSGAGGTSGAGAWECQDNSGDCVCVQVPGGTPQDTCTTKPSCCIESLSGGTDTCICTDLTGTGVTCAQLAPAIMGTVVSTCPPP